MTLPESKLTRSQYFKTEIRKNPETGGYVKAELRYDDRCGNGHNTFAITADVWQSKRKAERGGEPDSCGCCHLDVAQTFPEYAHLIKWHLTSSDEPLHYVANTLYHAKDRENINYDIGEPTKYKTRLGFIGCPFTFKLPQSAIDFIIDRHEKGHRFELEQVPHRDNPNVFSPNYTLKGYKGDHKDPWTAALWVHHQDGIEFIQALNTYEPVTIDTPIAWNQAKEANLEAARSAAAWPDATLEQLQNKEALEERLPALMAEFKADMEALGFTY